MQTFFWRNDSALAPGNPDSYRNKITIGQATSSFDAIRASHLFSGGVRWNFIADHLTGDIMEIMRKQLYHATVVKNVQPEDPPIDDYSNSFLIELNTDDGQYHSISLSENAATQLQQQLSQVLKHS